jgi:hypothetical protein
VTVPNSLVAQLAAVVARLRDSIQQLSLLMRDRDSPQQPQPAATLLELDALVHRYAATGVVLPPSYRAFLCVHNGWRRFAGDSHMLSAGDHGAQWVAAALAERRWLSEDQSLLTLVPVLLGTSPSSLAAFLDPGVVAPDGEMDVVLTDGNQLLTRYPGFLPFLDEHGRHLDRAIRIQLEGDEP